MSSSKRGRLSGGRGRSSTSHTAQGPPHLIPNPNEPAPQLSRPLYQQQLSQLYSGYSVRAPPPFFVPMTQLPPIYPPPNLSQLPHLQTYGAARYPPPGPGVTRPSDANRPRSSSAPVAMPGSHPLNWYQMIYCPFATPALSTNPMDHVLRQQYPVASYNPLEGYIARQLQSPALGSESCSVSPRDVESPPPPPYNPMLGRLQEHATAQHIFRLANPNSHMPPNFDDVTMQRKVSIWEVDENDESSMFTSNDHPRICPAKLPIQEGELH